VMKLGRIEAAFPKIKIPPSEVVRSLSLSAFYSLLLFFFFLFTVNECVSNAEIEKKLKALPGVDHSLAKPYFSNAAYACTRLG
jgi:hypothetical protein